MVVRRTINHIKTRPHHERRAVALMISIGVIVLLFFVWAFFFFTSLHASQLADSQAREQTLKIQENQNATQQTAAATVSYLDVQSG
jgi:ATP-dependent Zn protease